jgi:hypothetical protein
MEELTEVVHDMGENPSDEQVSRFTTCILELNTLQLKALMKSVDVNNNGMIEYSEFVKFVEAVQMKKKHEEEEKEREKQAFQLLLYYAEILTITPLHWIPISGFFILVKIL